MKSFIIFIVSLFLMPFSHAQEVQTILNGSIDLSKNLNNIKINKSQNKSGFGRWYNYGATMELFHGSTSPLYGNYLFPDSTILVNYGISGYAGPWIHKLGDVLDVSAAMFNDVNLHPGELNLDASSFYSLDSIEIYCIYNRKNPFATIVDTLVVEVSVNSTLSDSYFGPGTLPSNLGTDSVFFKKLLYSYQSNSLNLTGKQVYKIPLTHQTYADSLSTGVHVLKIATTGLPTVAPGKLIATAVGFIPGYTWTANQDTLDKQNSLFFISRKENNNQFPFYTKHDYNVSYIVPQDVRYNNLASWNGNFIPSFAYMGSTPTYRYEHHLIYYKISSSFNISSSYQHISCYNGSNGYINLTVAGGTAPYTYVWSNGATTQNIQNLSAGNYSVTISDAQNEEVVRSFTLTQPTQIQANISSTPTSACGISDGAVVISGVQGGTPSYSIIVLDADSLTQAMTGLGAGIYTVKITDSKGCKLIAHVPVNETGAPIVNVQHQNISCYGLNNGSIALSLESAISPTYAWSNGGTNNSLTNLSIGTYNVTITDGNCLAFGSYIITQPEQIQINGTVNDATGNQTNGSIFITVSGGISPYTYSWSTGQTTQYIANLATGSYTLTVTDANSCTQTASFNIISTHIEGTDLSKHFHIYPNPCKETLFLTSPNVFFENALINIYSIHGKLEKSIDLRFKNNLVNIDVSFLKAGIYFIEINTNDQKMLTRFIKI